MGKGKQKKVKAVSSQSGKKVNLNISDSSQDCPVFRFNKRDRDGKFAFDLRRHDFNAELVLSKIMDYSCMTWQEIARQTHDGGKSKHHYLSDPSRLSKDALDRLKMMQLEEEVEALFSFALTNKIRIVGIRSGRDFFVLWYDPEHGVYPVKRN